VLLNQETKRKPEIGKWLVRAIRSTKVTATGKRAGPALIFLGSAYDDAERGLLHSCNIERLLARNSNITGNPSE
jgi:precorrin-6x reductase